MAHELPADLTTGSVAIDVGDGVGALLIVTGATRVGEEIEVEPVGRTGARTHVAVLTRRVGERIAHAAVFPSLHAGEYAVLRDDGSVAARVTVPAAGVAELDWRYS
jgi:hypothetical protein